MRSCSLQLPGLMEKQSTFLFTETAPPYIVGEHLSFETNKTVSLILTVKPIKVNEPNTQPELPITSSLTPSWVDPVVLRRLPQRSCGIPSGALWAEMSCGNIAGGDVPKELDKIAGFLGWNIRNDVPWDEDFVGGFFLGYFGFNPRCFRSLGIILV